MPQMGESIVEGTLTKWLKKAGDSVERDEPLFEISTDKVDTEIPAPAAGVLTEVLVQEGETVQVNSVVARIGDAARNGESGTAAPVAAAVTAPPAAEPAPPPAAMPEPEGAGPYPNSPGPAPAPVASEAPKEVAGPTSPLVKKMARENNIDLAKITGTGAGGRITKEDVEGYLKTAAAPPAAAPAAAAAPRHRHL